MQKHSSRLSGTFLRANGLCVCVYTNLPACHVWTTLWPSSCTCWNPGQPQSPYGTYRETNLATRKKANFHNLHLHPFGVYKFVDLLGFTQIHTRYSAGIFLQATGGKSLRWQLTIQRHLFHFIPCMFSKTTPHNPLQTMLTLLKMFHSSRWTMLS